MRALKRMGNTVLSVRCNEFQDKRAIKRNDLILDIQKFSPDIVITFNNQFPHCDIIDEMECPILCFASNSIAFFENLDKIKLNLEKYYFFHFSNDTKLTIGNWISGVRDERNILFGQATDLRAENIEQDIDISFIGSIANWNRSLSSYFANLHATGWLDAIRHRATKMK